MWPVLALACSDAPVAERPEPWIAPENEWPTGSPPVGLVGQGFDPGEVVADARLPDQHEHVVALWQFSGRVTLVSIGAVWCDPCRDLAQDLPPLLEELGDDVVHVTVLEEDGGGGRPAVTDAADWAEAFGDDAPVLADIDRVFAGAVAGAYPVVLVVGRDLRVVATRIAPTADQARGLAAGAL